MSKFKIKYWVLVIMTKKCICKGVGNGYFLLPPTHTHIFLFLHSLILLHLFNSFIKTIVFINALSSVTGYSFTLKSGSVKNNVGHVLF